MVCIVGNKEDLIEKEAITPNESKEYAKSIGALFRKVSAKTSYGVEQMFRDLSLKLDSNLNVRDSKEYVNSIYLENPTPPAKKKKRCC